MKLFVDNFLNVAIWLYCHDQFESQHDLNNLNYANYFQLTFYLFEFII